jgi:hypothetical protein
MLMATHVACLGGSQVSVGTASVDAVLAFRAERDAIAVAIAQLLDWDASDAGSAHVRMHALCVCLCVTAVCQGRRKSCKTPSPAACVARLP